MTNPISLPPLTTDNFEVANEPLVHAAFELQGEAPLPDQRPMDGEVVAVAVAEVEDVEEAPLGLVLDQRLALEGGLEVPKDHRSLADGEDTKLREGLSPVGDAVAAEEAPVADAAEV